MRAQLSALILLISLAACGGGGSGSGGPTTPTPATWSLGGSVTDVITGQAVSGATLAFSGHSSVTTDASGRWTLQGQGTAPASTTLPVTATASGFLARQTRVEWKAGRTDVALTLIPDKAPFSLSLYRELIRNGLEAPGSLEPLRRWTTNPGFYLNALNPATNARLLDPEIAIIEQTIRSVVPHVTGGLLNVATFEVGNGPRAAQANVINIDIIFDPASEFCGRAQVGSNPGLITLNYDRCRNSACPETFSSSVVAHELGHALGLWHTSSGMMANRIQECHATTYTEAERVHARVAYMRPIGNLDIDVDPATFQAMAEEPRPIVELSCGRGGSSNAPATRR